MQNVSHKSYTKTKVTEGILSTLAFFDLYKLPVSSQRVHELLYRTAATLQEVEDELRRLVRLEMIVHKEGLYALHDWDHAAYLKNQQEIKKRWSIIRKHYWLLSAVPFVESVCVINSVAMGNADHESDIDFFVITKPRRLYFARTWIILLFKLLGVYKNRKVTNEKFCFGFYITSDLLSIKHLLLEGEDPYLVFWLATIIPITGERTYEKFLKENKWIYGWFPNFRSLHRVGIVRDFRPSRRLKKFLEWLAFIPAAILEPFLRRVHVRHTFKLPENHWKTSSTIANESMLKLHALDPRKDLRSRFYKTLQSYR